MLRRLLASLAILSLAFTVSALADTTPKPKAKSDGPEIRGKADAVVADKATEQAALKRAFESLVQRLTILAGRLENGTDADKEKAKSLRNALKAVNELGTGAKFDALINVLTKKGADRDLDALAAAIRDNGELRKDLQKIIALLAKDDGANKKEEADKLQRLLDQLKELIAKQERVRAQTEMGRKSKEDLGKDQKKVSDETKEAADGKKGGDKKDDEKKGEGKGEGKSGAEGKGEGKDDTKAKGEGRVGEGKDTDPTKGEGKPGEGKDGGKDGENKPGDGKPGAESKDPKAGEGKGGDPKSGEAGKPGDEKPGAGKGDEGKGDKGGEGKPGDGKGDKGGDPKAGEGKGGAGKPGKGEGKGGEGKGGGKPGEGKPSEGKGSGSGKGEGKPGAGKPGAGKPSSGGGKGQGGGMGKPGEGKPSPGGMGGMGGDKPPEDNPVKKQLEDANKYQKQAEDDLKKDMKGDASDNQGKAIEELEKAKKKLEELLKQMREEELERLLADLEKRCRYMLALQIEVRDATVVLDKDVQKSGKPELAHAARANKEGDKEEEILREAHAALKLIKTEGSAVAFAEVFEQVSKDMEVVMNRLRKTDVGAVTIRIENDIIETLKEMIEALKKQQKDMKSPPPKPGEPKPSGPQQKSLIDQLAELKMIFAMQKRVNGRTELYGKEYKGEQLTPPPADADPKVKEKYESIKGELKDLADRQQKIGKVTKDIATGKNEGGGR